MQTCWPHDAGPLITWGLVVTRGPQNVPKPRTRQNLGIYRQQVIARDQVIMRWLSHRGGALDFREFKLAQPGQPFPIAVALGADPATMLGAVTPVPDALSEYQFAGLLRGGPTEVSRCVGNDLQVPARAEIVLEGVIAPAEREWTGRSEHGVELAERDGYLHALEGPFGDHTGYYNERDWFPVFTVERITMRDDPVYHSTYTGKPPDEPSVLGVALNEVFVPLLQKQFTEIVDFYLPPEGCSYRMAVVSIRKSYAGHAKRVMFGIWSFLRQFMYTKFIVVVDDDVDVRDWKEVVWAITTRVDPTRDTTLVDHTPIDYLDFASPVSGLGSKMGIDATNKWPGRDDARVGSSDRDGRGREGARRRDVERPRPVVTRRQRPASGRGPPRSTKIGGLLSIRRTVEVMHASGPGGVGHVGPMVVIESRCVLEFLLRDIEREAMIGGVELQCFPGNGEQLRSHAEKAAERQHGIGDLAAVHVEHDFLDVAEIFVGRVVDIVADQRVGAHQSRAGPIRLRRCIHAVSVSCHIVRAFGDVLGAIHDCSSLGAPGRSPARVYVAGRRRFVQCGIERTHGGLARCGERADMTAGFVDAFPRHLILVPTPCPQSNRAHRPLAFGTIRQFTCEEQQ